MRTAITFFVLACAFLAVEVGIVVYDTLNPGVIL